jgi:hypothetical protein
MQVASKVAVTLRATPRPAEKVTTGCSASRDNRGGFAAVISKALLAQRSPLLSRRRASKEEEKVVLRRASPLGRPFQPRRPVRTELYDEPALAQALAAGFETA